MDQQMRTTASVEVAVRLLPWRIALAALLSVCCAGRSTADDEQLPKVVTSLLEGYCLDCHNSVEPAAQLDLSEFSQQKSIALEHQHWALILNRIEAGEMPPADVGGRPDAEQTQLFVQTIRRLRREVAERQAGQPGSVLARRLSNAEYNHCIRDLTEVDLQPAKTFPVDPANSVGFDNTGESLTMSPALLTKYLAAARQVAEHAVLTTTDIRFAAHQMVTDTDRDKYCVRRIVDFYENQPTNLQDYFLACVECSTTPTLLQRQAAAQSAQISPRYLELVWQTLHQENTVGPLLVLQQMFHKALQQQSTDMQRAACAQMQAYVHSIRTRLVPQWQNLQAGTVHKGSQCFVLWKNQQYANHRMSYDEAALTPPPDRASDDADTDTSDDAQPRSAPIADGNEPSAKPGNEADRKTADALTPDPQTTPPELQLPHDVADQQVFKAAVAEFCRVFPDQFYVSERGRDYLDVPKEKQEKGRLLSAGFHSMMGYFRDDAPLYQLILDDEQQRQLDLLWLELDVITFAPLRQYQGFLWFERTDSRFMRDPQFDFARPEDRESAQAEMIERLAEVYLQKAREEGGEQAALTAIESYFRNISSQIRTVEQVRLQSEAAHLQSLAEFASRAWRHSAAQAEIDSLLHFYNTLRRDEGLTHDEAIRDSIVAVLMSPGFLYRTDLISRTPEIAAYPAHDLASRLSFFLWASQPDAQLVRTLRESEKAQGRISPELILTQTQAMLTDARISGLATEFAANWLDIRRFQEHNSVDRELYGQFTPALREAMYQEPLRLFQHLVRSNGSLLDLLSCDYTHVNAELAAHYGLPDQPPAGEWRRIDGLHQVGRGGLSGMAVFLTKNSPGLRTSPVKRGYWVVRRLLGEQIPAPPPDVPELPADESSPENRSLRESLEQHRAHVACAGCHDRFDAIGLAFESFGPIGERRTLDRGGRPIDDSVMFPRNVAGTGLTGLNQYLMQHRRDEFVDNFCRKLLSFALGRSLMLSDELLIEKMQQDLIADNYRVQTLFRCIVTSPQFLNRQGNTSRAETP